MAGKYLSVQLHFVWSTTRRMRWVSRNWRDDMYAYMRGVVTNKGGKVLEIGGTDDHVHACVAMPSTITIAEMINAMKTNSSRWVHDNHINNTGYSWQKGYGAFSVSRSAEESVRKYIREQEEHHKTRSFQEEFVALLKLHQIDYDPRYVLD
jgi:putative transposase